jgi:hypothetical protein
LLAAEVALSTGIARTLALVEVGLATGGPVANSVIRSDDFANLFGGRDAPEYQNFVFAFQIFEAAANLGVAKTSIYSSIGESGLMANRLARSSPEYSPDHQVFAPLREMSVGYGDMLWVDYPKVRRLVNQLDGVDGVGDDIFRLTPEALLRLDRDIASLGGDWYLKLKEPGGIAAYSILEKVGDWRTDVDLLGRLANTVKDRPALKLKLLEEGENGVVAWRMVEESRPNTNILWCNSFN